MFKRLEASANIAIILVAAALLVVLAKQQFFTNRPAATDSVSVGKRISIVGLDWSTSPRHLVLAVAEGCHFCTESGGFYQRLAQTAAGSDVHVVAVLPQEVAEGREYLSGIGVNLADVRKVSFATLGVTGTPTVMLVDSTGAVKKVWVGKLSPEGEADVLNALHAKIS